MKRNSLDELIRLAYLEGVVTTRGAYESHVASRHPGGKASDAFHGRLLRRLEQALASSHTPAQPSLTVGGFLMSLKVRTGQEIASRLGVTMNQYRMLEHDRLSPLKLPVPVWKNFGTLFRLSLDDLEQMIRRTHQLVVFRPSFRTTLARYDTRTRRGKKSAAIEQAATELYTRASLRLPLGEQHDIDAMLQNLRTALP